MVNATNAGSNGKARKTLSSQLDRLDEILDVLGNGLNEAVRDAVQAAAGEAVRAAVEAALSEALADPAFLARLRAAQAAHEPAAPAARASETKPSLLHRLRQCVSATREALTSAVGHACHSVRQRLSGVWKYLWLVRQFRGQLAAAAGVGLAVAVVALAAGPWVAGRRQRRLRLRLGPGRAGGPVAPKGAGARPRPRGLSHRWVFPPAGAENGQSRESGRSTPRQRGQPAQHRRTRSPPLLARVHTM